MMQEYFTKDDIMQYVNIIFNQYNVHNVSTYIPVLYINKAC